MTALADPFEAGRLIGKIVGGGEGELALLGDPQQHGLAVQGKALQGHVVMRQALDLERP